MHLTPPTNADCKYVQSTDHTVIYADAVGDPANPALIFTHGLGTCVDVFNDIFSEPDLSKEFYLIRYDQRGFGRSGKPQQAESHTSDKYAQDFEAVMTAFGAKSPIFIGWSMGGRILADIVAHLPEGIIRGAVVIAGFPFSSWIQSPETPMRPAFASYIMPWVTSSDTTTENNCTLAFNRLICNKDLSLSASFLEDTIKKSEAGYDFVQENPAITFDMRLKLLGMTTLMSPNIRRMMQMRQTDETKIIELGKNGFPLLFVQGTHDAHFDWEKSVKVIKPVFPKLEVAIIEDTSHVLFMEKPKETMEPIFHFAHRVTKA